MKLKFLPDEITYNGTQLSSAFVEKIAGPGMATAAFIGPAAVPTDNLVDGDDAAAGSVITSERMVHFIMRLPELDLAAAVPLQRLLMVIIAESISGLMDKPGGIESRIDRLGDDLYLVDAGGTRKMTVSIATNSRLGGSLVHIGINVTGEGAPVPAAGLTDIGVDELAFTRDALKRFACEFAEIEHAKSKVRPVD